VLRDKRLGAGAGGDCGSPPGPAAPRCPPCPSSLQLSHSTPRACSGLRRRRCHILRAWLEEARSRVPVSGSNHVWPRRRRAWRDESLFFAWGAHFPPPAGGQSSYPQHRASRALQRQADPDAAQHPLTPSPSGHAGSTSLPLTCKKKTPTLARQKCRLQRGDGAGGRRREGRKAKSFWPRPLMRKARLALPPRESMPPQRPQPSLNTRCASVDIWQ
jgi:hypothetical protein